MGHKRNQIITMLHMIWFICSCWEVSSCLDYHNYVVLFCFIKYICFVFVVDQVCDIKINVLSSLKQGTEDERAEWKKLFISLKVVFCVSLVIWRDLIQLALSELVEYMVTQSCHMYNILVSSVIFSSDLMFSPYLLFGSRNIQNTLRYWPK